MATKTKPAVFEWAHGSPDDEILPVTRCVCGAKYRPWEFVISIYDDAPTEMPCCGRKVYFRQEIEIVEVE